MRTSGQIGTGLGAGAALALVVVWLLGRTIGLSVDEASLLSSALTAIFGAAGAIFAPLTQRVGMGANEKPPGPHP